ncbi:hypothetical protein B0H10DRAFT_1943509 [Mycena sp. CBHHK59/15]|nr:hypothetical protein B0H10DRAFT_1943509 [Mycena sp. CBHHK59/15]
MTFRNLANNGTESEGGRGGNWTLLPKCVHTQNTEQSGAEKVSRDQDRRESDRIMFNPIKDQCLGECRSSESIKVYGGPMAGRDGMAHNVEHREVKLGANRVYNPKCRQNELLARGYAGGWQVMKIVNGMEVRRNSVEVEVSLSSTEVLAASEQVAKLRSWDRREMSDMRGAGKWQPEYTVKDWTSSGPIGRPKVPVNRTQVESKNMLRDGNEYVGVNPIRMGTLRFGDSRRPRESDVTECKYCEEKQDKSGGRWNSEFE